MLVHVASGILGNWKRKSNMADINIERIIEEIKQEIKDKGITEDLEQTFDFPTDEFTIPVLNITELEQELRSASNNHYIDPVRPLGNSFKGKIKRLIRKCLLFYIKPIVEDINLYNSNTIYILTQFYSYIHSQETYKKRMDRILERLLYENSELQKQLNEIKSK